MNELAGKKCVPCKGGMKPLARAEARQFLKKLASGWTLSRDGRQIRREYRFKDFYRTMSFVNGVACIANSEDHHPDIELGYNYCKLRFTTHTLKGLSENDFICAAKIDRLTG